ncbi:MAG: glycosyltransferase [Enterocloster bolteae]
MSNREHNFISNIVYVENDEDRIEIFLQMIAKCMLDNFEHSEIICVNDCSSDKSLDTIKKFSKTLGGGLSVTVVNMNQYHGVEKSMGAGVNLSIGDFVFEFDSVTLGFEAEDIMAVYKKALSGYDIVSAATSHEKRISSVLFYWVFNSLFEGETDLKTESFRILSRRAINRVQSITERTYYRKAIYANCGLKSSHYSYKYLNKQNESVKNNKYRITMAIDALILFTKVGFFSSMMMTCAMAAVLIGMLAYAIIFKMLSNPVPGWTSTICFLSFCFLGIFAVSSIVIKYLQLIIELLFKKKECLFESIEKLI